MAYSFKIEELDGSFRGCKHQAVIYRDGERVSSHRTRKGETVAIQEAKGVIKFYEKQDARDRAGR